MMETEFDSPRNTENPLAEDPSPPPPERPPDDGGESLADGALDALEALNECAATTPLNRWLRASACLSVCLACR